MCPSMWSSIWPMARGWKVLEQVSQGFMTAPDTWPLPALCPSSCITRPTLHNAGSGHVEGPDKVMNPSLTCSNTFSLRAIWQIEDHMNGHVPNDGRLDGCWCEKMLNFGNRPWWWKFPWVYWGPFKPADLPELDFPDVYELPPNELPPKEIPGLDVKPLPEEPLPKDPLLEKDPNVPIDPRGPRTTAPIPPPKRKGPDVAGEVVCQSVMRRRRCNKAPGCEWEGPRKAKQGGRCVA